MKIYISGSITDGGEITDPAEILKREQVFHDAERDLLAAGYDVLNPARKEGREECDTWQDYMRASIRDIAEADALAVLPGYEKSRGALVEIQLAGGLGLPQRPLAQYLQPTALSRGGMFS